MNLILEKLMDLTGRMELLTNVPAESLPSLRRFLETKGTSSKNSVKKGHKEDIESSNSLER